MRALVAAAAVSLTLTITVAASPAAADGNGRGAVDVDQAGDGDATVGVTAGTTGGPVRSSGGTVRCDVYETPITQADGTAFLAPGSMVEGSFYWLHCQDVSTAPPTQLTSRYFLYRPGEPALSPLALAQRASATLRLAAPTPSTNPAGAQVAGIESWLWIDPEQWQPATATASIPGLSASVTATPRSVTWDPADGSAPLVCAGPGAVYDPSRDPDAQSTDCSHVFQVRGTYAATATITYELAWSASDGSAGTLHDGTRTTTFLVRVHEHQAVGS